MTYKAPIGMENVRKIREMAARGDSPKVIHADHFPDLALATVYSIIRGDVYRDSSYTPPPHAVWGNGKGKKRVHRKRATATTLRCTKCGLEQARDQFYCYTNPKGVRVTHRHCKTCHNKYPSKRKDWTPPPARVASIDCKYTCLTCGMGFDTDADARACCAAFAAVARGDSR